VRSTRRRGFPRRLSRALAWGFGLGSPVAAAAGLCLLLVSACDRQAEDGRGSNAPADALSPNALVRVGGEVLTEEAFAALLPAEFRGLLTAEEKRATLERWVDTELLYRAAAARGLADDPEIQRRFERQRREFLADRLLQQVLAERVLVTESDIADYYAAHLEEWASEYRCREIVVAAEHEAQDIHAKLLAKRLTFATAVEKYSLAGTARLGGDLGWLPKGGLVHEVGDRVVTLRVGEITPPIETAWGWAIILLSEKRPAANALDLPEVRDEILRILTMERRRRTYAEYLEELARSYGVSYHARLDERLRADSYAPPDSAQPYQP
jgi:hypothetical protein